MKKWFACLLGVTLLAAPISVAADDSVLEANAVTENAEAAIEVPVWQEDVFDVQVYIGIRGETYTVEYGDLFSENIPIGEQVYLLMVNGGFVPVPQIVLENSRTLMPAQNLCEPLGVEMEWVAGSQTVTMTDDTITITLTADEKQIIVNGEAQPMDVASMLIDGEIYVPIRFVAEAFGAAVQYIPNINALSTAGGTPESGSHMYDYVQNIKTIVIETATDAEVNFTMEEGFAAAQEASRAAYQQMVDAYKEQGITEWWTEYNPVYDPDRIEYTDFDMGRYYVYQLYGFKNYPIFFNKYTGELFSRHAGLPGIFVVEGFMNIGWMYQ